MEGPQVSLPVHRGCGLQTQPAWLPHPLSMALAPCLEECTEKQISNCKQESGDIRNLSQGRPLACLQGACNTAPGHRSLEVPRPALPLGLQMSGGRGQLPHLPLRAKSQGHLTNPKANICCRMRGSLCSQDCPSHTDPTHSLHSRQREKRSKQRVKVWRWHRWVKRALQRGEEAEEEDREDKGGGG